MAVAQDMLILIYKFLADFYKYRWRPRGKIAIGAPIDLSDDKEDPNEIRARKALLRLAKPGRDEVSEINDADVDALPTAKACSTGWPVVKLSGASAWAFRASRTQFSSRLRASFKSSSASRRPPNRWRAATHSYYSRNTPLIPPKEHERTLPILRLEFFRHYWQ